MNHIDFEAKSDRELLILVAQKTNELVDHCIRLNGDVARHDRDIAVLQGNLRGCNIMGAKEAAKILVAKWQFWATTVGIISGVVYGIGRAYGWW